MKEIEAILKVNEYHPDIKEILLQIGQTFSTILYRYIEGIELCKFHGLDLHPGESLESK